MSTVTQSAARIIRGDRTALRVLHLSAGNLYGGVETLLVTLARERHLCPEMAPHFAVCYEGRLSRELRATGAPVYVLDEAKASRPWTVWRARRQLRNLLAREKFLVISHMPWPLAIFGGSARASGQKLVMWAHNVHSGRRWVERCARTILPDLVISTSRFVGASVANLYPNIESAVMYCPLAADELNDADVWRASTRKQLAVDDQTVVIVQVSRYEAWKGHLLHLQALSQLSTARPWVCWMVGGPQNQEDERHYAEVKRAAAQLGLNDQVKFLGNRSDVPRLLAGADIFCQPNQGPEPFGIVFVEALKAGLPVVTTAMGGALEIVDDSCGILVRPDSPEQLAGALKGLVESRDRRTRLGLAGPRRARILCDPTTQLRKLCELLKKLSTDHDGSLGQ